MASSERYHGKALARHDNEGALAWLERLQNSQMSHNKLSKQQIADIKKYYRQLRYGRLSVAETHSQEYQQVLKALKRGISQL